MAGLHAIIILAVGLFMAFSFVVSHARQGLVAASLFLSLLVPVVPAQAESTPYPTMLIDNFVITDVKGLGGDGQARSSKAFMVDPKDGPVWVMTNYLAEEGDEDALSVTSFDIMPDGVPVPAGSNIVRFPAQEMARFKPEEGLTLNVSGKTIKLTDNVLRELMTPEQFADLLKARESTKGVLQLVKLQHFNIPADTETVIRIDLTRLENMKPHSLEVVVGQGAVPPELETFMDKKNGSWFYRNRHMLGMIGFSALLGGWLWRRTLG